VGRCVRAHEDTWGIRYPCRARGVRSLVSALVWGTSLVSLGCRPCRTAATLSITDNAAPAAFSPTSSAAASSSRRNAPSAPPFRKRYAPARAASPLGSQARCRLRLFLNRMYAT
jgi:hypothetical protein